VIRFEHKRVSAAGDPPELFYVLFCLVCDPDRGLSLGGGGDPLVEAVINL
jgi:hypothetical protein